MGFHFLSNSAPITANAATAKVVGVGKSFTVKKTTKVSGLSKAEKKIVKVTVNKKKRTVTVKGLKAGKASFKIGKKAYTVKVGATKITKKTVATSMTAGETKTLSVNAVNGKGDTIQFTSSKKGVVKVNKASAKATAKKVASTKVTAVAAGTAKITAKSKYTGKSATFTITVKAADTPATQPPTVATTPAVTTATATPGVATTPAVQTTAPAGTDAAPTQDPNATKDPNATEDPNATKDPNATQDPTATKDPNATQDPNATVDPNATQNPDATQAPSDVTSGTITIAVTASGAALEGADIQVLSGTSVVASATSSDTTGFVTAPLANGTYTVVVSKAGYVTATKSVVVNGDVTLTVDLEMVKTVEITSISATNPNNYTDENKYEVLELNSELPTNATLNVKFSSVMNTDTVNINTIKMYKVDGNVPVGLAGVSFDKTKTVATVKPSSLEKNTEYKIIFTTSLASETGVKLAQTEYTFKTSNDGVLNSVYAVDATEDADNDDRANATLLGTNTDVYDSADPTSATSYSDAGDVYYITLDSKIDAGSFSSDTVVLKNVTDGKNVNIKTELATQDSIPGDGTLNVQTTVTLQANQTIKVTILDTLKQNKAYKFEVSGLRLANGGKATKITKQFVVNSQAPDFVAFQTVQGDQLKGQGTSEDDAVRVNGRLTALNLPGKNTPAAGFAIVINMSAETDDASISEKAFALTDVTNKKNIPFTISYDTSLKQIKLTPVSDLPEDATIKLTTSVDGEIKNKLGLGKPELDTYLHTYDLTAPTVTSVEGETTNLEVGKQHVVKINFSEAIGNGQGNGTACTANAGLVGFAQLASDKLSPTIGMRIVKAGVDPTEGSSDFIKIDSARLINDNKTIEVKFTPAATDIGKTFQLVLAGKNDIGNQFICDYANGTGNLTGNGDVTNPLAANYNLVLTMEVQDVTGPEVESIGTKKSTDTEPKDLFDTSKVTTFKDGATNIDADKDIVVTFNEKLQRNSQAPGTTLPLACNTAVGTAAQNGNVMLEKYNFTDKRWDKINLSGAPFSGSGNNLISVTTSDVEKKSAIVIPAAKVSTNTKYRLTVTPTVNNVSIKDDATDPNTMAVKYSVEFTTGEAEGLENTASDATYIGKVKDATPSSSSTLVLSTFGLDGAYVAGDLVAIELADGSLQYTTVTASGTDSNGNDEITLNDQTSTKVNAGAKVYNLTSDSTITYSTDVSPASNITSGENTFEVATGTYKIGDLLKFAESSNTQYVEVTGVTTNSPSDTVTVSENFNYNYTSASAKINHATAVTRTSAANVVNSTVDTDIAQFVMSTNPYAAGDVLRFTETAGGKTYTQYVMVTDVTGAANPYTYKVDRKFNYAYTAAATITKMPTGVLGQYATGFAKDEPILVQVTATAGLDEDTIKNAVKLYKTSDNSVVDADVSYYVVDAEKTIAWVTINPTENLAAATNYYVKVDGLKDKLGNTQSDNSKKKVLSFKTASEVKKASVSNISIYDGQMNVGVKDSITFDVADVTDFNKAKVYLDNSAETTASYDDKTGKVTVVMDVLLKANTGYTLTIDADAFGGTALDDAITVNFETGKAVKPAVKSVKHVEAGESGLADDTFIITLDSKIANTLNNNGVLVGDFDSLFTVSDGLLTKDSVSSVKISEDQKTITVILKSTGLEAGAYVVDGQTKFKAAATLKTNGSGDDVIFDDTAVTVTK